MEQTLSAILFDPLLPLWVLLPLVGIIFMVGVLNRRFARVLLALVLLGVLSGPVSEQKTLRPEKDVVVLVEDVSPSNSIQPRAQIREATTKNLRQQLASLNNVETVFLQTSGNAATGSDLFGQIRGRIGSVPQGRLSAVIAVTDGALAGVPEASPFKGAPFHAVSTSPADLYDRQLNVINAPTFGLLGKELSVSFKIKDTRYKEADVTIKVGSKERPTISVPTNTEVVVKFTLEHAGSTALAISTPVMQGELTPRNNKAVKLMTGVRENLNVLLVSGLPHNGTQVIRSLLKSDPAINLVHFTILRTLGKIDPTPDDQLALIPFPVEDLFSKDLKKFDLIVFDRYIHRGFIKDRLFRNIVEHVRGGRAVLVLAGPDYNTSFELPATQLQTIMPVKPAGEERRTPYTPTLSDVGNRHPITAPFADEQDRWGNFASLLPAQQTRGRKLMQGPGGQPLLVTAEEGEGRVAVWLSNNWWYWSRGIDGGGPQVALMRRLSHWLMRQPDLEERRLELDVSGSTLNISYHDVDPTAQMPVRVTKPSGDEEALTLDQEQGLKGTATAEDDGLYSVKTADGEVLAYAVKGQVRDFEWRREANLPALKTLAEKTGGAFVPAKQAETLKLRPIRPDSRTHGPGWIGLPEKNNAALEGTSQKPLIPAWLGLVLMLLAIVGTWWLEAVRFSK